MKNKKFYKDYRINSIAVINITFDSLSSISQL